MPQRPHKRMSKRVSDQAADWAVRLNEGLSSADRLKYVHWLKQSPDHVHAMLELGLLEGLLRGSDLSGMPPPQGHSEPSDTAAVVVELNPKPLREDTPVDERRASPWRQWKVAASLCLSRVGLARRAISRFVGN